MSTGRRLFPLRYRIIRRATPSWHLRFAFASAELLQVDVAGGAKDKRKTGAASQRSRPASADSWQQAIGHWRMFAVQVGVAGGACRVAGVRDSYLRLHRPSCYKRRVDGEAWRVERTGQPSEVSGHVRCGGRNPRKFAGDWERKNTDRGGLASARRSYLRNYQRHDYQNLRGGWRVAGGGKE